MTLRAERDAIEVLQQRQRRYLGQISRMGIVRYPCVAFRGRDTICYMMRQPAMMIVRFSGCLFSFIDNCV